MPPLRLLLSGALLFAVVSRGGVTPPLRAAQDYAPPPPQKPDDVTLKAIGDRADRLAAAIGSERRRGVADHFLVEAEIYLKAAEWITRHNEFYQKDYAAWTLDALDRGLLRAAQIAQGEAPWRLETGHRVVRAYRSNVDGSVQPYAVTLPADFGKDAHKSWRLDVVLHGRNSSLTEVSFLHEHDDNHATPADQTWAQLDIYGRGNNGYRWAGEMDVFEALDAFSATLPAGAPLLDPSRVVLRGFSMGGAGSWHMGLHHPERWCVVGPGAGFTTTHGYVKGLPDPLPPHQEACLRIYDAVDYAENAADVPVVAYAGADDPQLQAARNIEAKLKPLGVPMTLLVAPGLKHQFPAEWQKKAQAEYAKYADKGRPAYPPHVHFVTYTLKYPTCAWVELLGLEEHYQRTLVDATQTETGYDVKTANVRALHLGLPQGTSRQPQKVNLDGQSLEVRPYLNAAGTTHLYLARQGGTWSAVLPEKILTERLRRLQKVPNLQGPIDDAFTGPFLCVRGTGKAWHETTQKYAEANLQRFQDEWDKYLRGELPVKDDVDVTPADLSTRNLILFGDPASNSLIEQVVGALPVQWTKERITLAGKSVSAEDHVPVLIYPSPLNPSRYVVLNSGHTFHAADFQGTNALLYPRLGDYALLKPAPTEKDPAAAEVIGAGLFNDSWQTK